PPVRKAAPGERGVSVGRIGPSFEITAEGPIVIDRRATGCRHAGWYSSVAGGGPRSPIAPHAQKAAGVVAGAAPGWPNRPERQERAAGGARVSSPERPEAERLGAGRYLAAGERPEATVTSVHELTTADGATVRGVLATVAGG